MSKISQVSRISLTRTNSLLHVSNCLQLEELLYSPLSIETALGDSLALAIIFSANCYLPIPTS